MIGEKGDLLKKSTKEVNDDKMLEAQNIRIGKMRSGNKIFDESIEGPHQ